MFVYADTYYIYVECVCVCVREREREIDGCNNEKNMKVA